ncbi:ATP-dependent nuclease [Tenacibaculum maritimum]|uniref:ATP-dependent nuclease n=1 Tax=Tenacibaculum maritimum TaxID=107401 RepID=UPI003875D1BA
MHISKLSLRNFRNFRNVSLNFQKGVNTIIGENGSGKTNLFHALRILIDESMPRGVKLFETDFNRTIENWRGHWIVIQIEFEELDSSDEAQSIAVHKTGHADDETSTKGTYSLFFRPRIDIRRSLYELSSKTDKTKEELEAILSLITLNDYEVVFAGKGIADFSEDAVYNSYVGNFDDIIFPNPEDENTDIYGVKMYGISIPNEFACTFAKALRDVESDLRSYRQNPLLNLLRDREKTISLEKKTDLEKKVSDLNSDISNLEEVKGLSKGISETIQNAVGETYAPNINIKSELPSETEKLLQSLKLWVGDPDEEGYEGRLWELSLGGANLIYLTLKLLEFEKIKSQDKIANFILIEEPEAHIHTHIQKSLFHKLNKNHTQVFVSTHSTHISSVSKISSMNILGRKSKQTEVYNPINNLDSSNVVKLERYLDANRTNLLFAKGVILVEGDAEHILIPELTKKVLGITLDELGISIINIGSTGFQNVAQLFHNDRVKRKCSIITDNDISIVPLKENQDEDTAHEKSCRASQKSGEERKEKLDEFCNGNVFIESFYAKHTFEVDFINDNNAHEIVETVKSEYKQKERIKAISKLLKNKDVSIFGKEVLRLADKFGKGWFAIMVSNKVTNLTSIPDYILDAISFASPRLDSKILYPIAKYRLNSFTNNSFEGDDNDYTKILKVFESKDKKETALAYFKKTLPRDVLSKLI